jgi:hypothetical protein
MSMTPWNQLAAIPAAIAIAIAIVTLISTPAWNRSLDNDRDDECHGDHVPCIACALYCRYEEALAEARVDVAALPNGIVIHYASEKPATIVELQRFAYERRKLHQQMVDAETLNRFCERCRHKTERTKGARYEVGNSAHGAFAVVTSDEDEIVRALHELAAEVTLTNDVRGS